MGRPSKLTDKQWAEIGRRLLAGEKPADLARELGINRAQITRRFSQQVRNVKAVAQQIVTAEEALAVLPVAQQVEALTLADELRAISIHIAGAGKTGAMLSRRLIGLAHMESDKIDEANMGESLESLKTVSALTKMANDASTIPLNLLAANKDSVRAANAESEAAAQRATTEGAARERIAGRLARLTTPRGA